MSRVFGALLRIGASLALCVGSVGIAIVAFPLADYRKANEDMLAHETVDVLSRTTRRTESAGVDLLWSERRVVKLNGLSGTVTGIFVSSGKPVACGEPVIAIDGATRLAMCGDVPPWRDITASTTGRDADQLAEMLIELGLLDETNRRDGWRRAAAWKQLSQFVGLPRADAFHPSDVFWTGDSPTPSRIDVRVGDHVSGDTNLFDIDARLDSAIVNPVAVGAGSVFSISGSGEEFPILADGSLDSRAFEAAVRSTLTEPDAALPTRIQGITRLTVPVSYDAIPATAVVTANDGSSCVVLEKGGTVAVKIVESVTGLVLVDSDLTEGVAIRDLPPAGTTC